MATENIKINTGLLTFRFSDGDDNEITKFVINPTDVHLMRRCEEVAADFDEMKEQLERASDAKEMSEAETIIAEKIDYMIGMKNGNTVFMPPLTATTVLPDGRLFAEVILDKVMTAIEPELRKRSAVVEKQMEKYTKKYE